MSATEILLAVICYLLLMITVGHNGSRRALYTPILAMKLVLRILKAREPHPRNFPELTNRPVLAFISITIAQAVWIALFVVFLGIFLAIGWAVLNWLNGT
jgi:hypothetical protein